MYWDCGATDRDLPFVAVSDGGHSGSYRSHDYFGSSDPSAVTVDKH